ncbi:flavin prenyltransferase UbiX [Planctobacterium marinum]|uniref:flavin prenyltransferase UbiX n=1 Tax=Planctobacterium marinum TaxID=1631968 RepID=UPI001E3674F2|nr:flavin prenyltransferase UbiX [Planctobacterium marinum]MCC2607686.1 UbiX family flavin prenyltransferase [Planctobacterium marinum]
MAFHKQITLAITGASGAPYSLKLLQCLVEANFQIHLLVSGAAKVVFATEEKLTLPGSPDKQSAFFIEYCQAKPEQIRCYGKEEWFSPVASGSAAPKTMIICPCSTSTLSSVATGASNTLIERAADVVIKEKGQLILLVREMPLSSIHLQNMLTLSNLGVTIMPAAPGFYHEPRSIDDLVDFVVARILDHVAIDNSLMQRWGYKPQA